MNSTPGSDDLATLARAHPRERDGALLRATAALFCQEPSHDREAIRRFEEIASNFLPKVSIEDRLHVANLLAERRDAPVQVVTMLARDQFTVAAPVLRHSPVLSTIDLLSIIAATGPMHHRVIAERAVLNEAVIRALDIAGTKYDAPFLPGVEVSSAATAIPDVASEGTPESADEPEPLTVTEDDTAVASDPASAGDVSLPETDGAVDTYLREYGPAGFLRLNPETRVQLISQIATRGAQAPSTPVHRLLDRAVRNAFAQAEIVTAARTADRPALVHAMAQVLDLESALVDKFLADPSGEPLVLMLRATGLKDSDGRVVLLLANPEIGESVEKFFRLADLYASLNASVAETFLAAWRKPADRRPTRHEPVFAEDRARRPAQTERPAAKPLDRREASEA